MANLGTLGGIGGAVNDFMTANAEGVAGQQAAAEHAQDREFQQQERTMSLQEYGMRLAQLRQQLESNLSPEAKAAQIQAKKNQLHNIVASSRIDPAKKQELNMMIDLSPEGDDIQGSVLKEIFAPPPVQKPPEIQTVGGKSFQWDAQAGKWVPAPGLPNEPPKTDKKTSDLDDKYNWARKHGMSDPQARDFAMGTIGKETPEDKDKKKSQDKVAQSISHFSEAWQAANDAEKTLDQYPDLIGGATGIVTGGDIKVLGFDVGKRVRSADQEKVRNAFKRLTVVMVEQTKAGSRGFQRFEQTFFGDNLVPDAEVSVEQNRERLRGWKDSISRATAAAMRYAGDRGLKPKDFPGDNDFLNSTGVFMLHNKGNQKPIPDISEDVTVADPNEPSF